MTRYGYHRVMCTSLTYNRLQPDDVGGRVIAVLPPGQFSQAPEMVVEQELPDRVPEAGTDWSPEHRAWAAYTESLAGGALDPQDERIITAAWDRLAAREQARWRAVALAVLEGEGS